MRLTNATTQISRDVATVRHGLEETVVRAITERADALTRLVDDRGLSAARLVDERTTEIAQQLEERAAGTAASTSTPRCPAARGAGGGDAG